jgi:hypothetical protein
LRQVRSILGSMIAESERQAFEEENDFKGWRALTFAEKKVNFKSIEREIDRLEASFDSEASGKLKEAKDTYIKALSAALHSKDKTRAKQVTMRAAVAYAAILLKHERDAFTYGKNAAAREIDRSTMVGGCSSARLDGTLPVF